MPNPATPPTLQEYLLVAALLDLGNHVLPMALCYLVVFSPTSLVPVQRYPLVWRLELQLKLQEAAVDLVFRDP